MVFHEHIIRVCAPGEVTRAALWAGLADFVANPQDYLDGAVGATLGASETDVDGTVRMARTLRFETGSFDERVAMNEAAGTVRIENDGDATRPASSFTMKIEEPEAGSLFLRCVYDQEGEHPAVAAQPHLADLLRQAYETKDQEVVRRILERAVS